MKELKCGNCKKILTNDMEIEYSEECCEYFCNPDCATNFYYDYMRSKPIDIENLENGIIVDNGKLYKKLP